LSNTPIERPTIAEMKAAWDNTEYSGKAWEELFDKYPEICNEFIKDYIDFRGEFNCLVK